MNNLYDFETIVLIADSVEGDSEILEVYDRELDRPNKEYVTQLIDALCSFHPNVVHYYSPEQLITNIQKHKNDLIFPFWFGEGSRNRHSIVPAVCEGANIRYIGGDAYTKIVCNDKSLSKLICRQSGLTTAKGFTINSEEDYSLLNALDFPCVVKPLFEGTSLGISDRNLVNSKEAATIIVKELQKEFNQPILVEEFVPGKEVSICLIGWKDKIVACEAAERFVVGDDSYFINKLYSYKEKKTDKIPQALRSVKSEIPNEIFVACKKVFSFLDKVEYMRIDGRLNDSTFTVIELTPETHLGDDAEFCGTFIASSKFSYQQVIQLLVENCLERYQNQSANR